MRKIYSFLMLLLLLAVGNTKASAATVEWESYPGWIRNNVGWVYWVGIKTPGTPEDTYTMTSFQFAQETGTNANNCYAAIATSAPSNPSDDLPYSKEYILGVSSNSVQATTMQYYEYENITDENGNIGIELQGGTIYYILFLQSNQTNSEGEYTILRQRISLNTTYGTYEPGMFGTSLNKAWTPGFKATLETESAYTVNYTCYDKYDSSVISTGSVKDLVGRFPIPAVEYYTFDHATDESGEAVDLTQEVTEDMNLKLYYRYDLRDTYNSLSGKIGDGLGQYHFGEGNSLEALKAAIDAKNREEANAIIQTVAINHPNGKLVRLYNPGTARYAGTSTSGMAPMVGEKAEAGIYYITEEGYLWSYNQGRFTASAAGIQPAAYGNAGGNFGFDDAKGYSYEGKYNMWNNGDHKGYLVAWTNATDRLNDISSESDLAKGAWEIQEVTEVAVTITDAGYATLFSPVALTVPNKVKAYTGEVNGSYLTLTEVPSGVIPAETAVVLAGEAGSYTFEVAASAAAISGNALQGALAGLNNTANTILTLQKINEEVGFYNYTGSTLAGTKAYLPASVVPETGEIKGLTFSFGTTDGIATVEGTTTEDAVIYNLAGQRVEKAVKGVYIINGKKVLVK